MDMSMKPSNTLKSQIDSNLFKYIFDSYVVNDIMGCGMTTKKRKYKLQKEI